LHIVAKYTVHISICMKPDDERNLEFRFELGTTLNREEFRKHLLRKNIRESPGEVDDYKIKSLANHGEMWVLCAVNPVNLVQVEVNVDTADPVLIAYNDVIKGRDRQIEAVCSQEKAIAAWVAYR